MSKVSLGKQWDRHSCLSDLQTNFDSSWRIPFDGTIAWVLVISGSGYLLSRFLASRLMEAFGIGLVQTVSTGLVAAATFGFGISPNWTAFLLRALAHGLGSGAIGAGLNGYAAHHMSARQVVWLHAC